MYKIDNATVKNLQNFFQKQKIEPRAQEKQDKAEANKNPKKTDIQSNHGRMKQKKRNLPGMNIPDGKLAFFAE